MHSHGRPHADTRYAVPLGTCSGCTATSLQILTSLPCVTLHHKCWGKLESLPARVSSALESHDGKLHMWSVLFQILIPLHAGLCNQWKDQAPNLHIPWVETLSMHLRRTTISKYTFCQMLCKHATEVAVNTSIAVPLDNEGSRH